MIPFAERLAALQQARQTDLALYLKPQLNRMPLPIQRYDDPFLPFAKAIIEATRDLVCAYVLDFAGYLTLGAAGAVALERTVALVAGDTMTILHGPFAGPDYAEAAAAFGVDAVTLADASPLSAYAKLGAFVVRSGTPTAAVGFNAYWEKAGVFTFADGSGGTIEMRIRLASADVLYVSHEDDFAQKTRMVVETMC